MEDRMLPKTKPDVICCAVDDGAVLLSTTDEVYFGLNRVGARIWELLPPERRTLGELCRTLEKEYPDAHPDDIRSDVTELLERLRGHGLVYEAA